ncbi:MAG: hypothetical protein NWF05_08425 [Candidatus Bathyarchaeota archaeon]|nr:hypothetical protein [Candidatus Bathyarchaeota archaeon]
MHNDAIFEEFIKATEQIRKDLNIVLEPETDRAESDLGFDFDAEVFQDSKGFCFCVSEEFDGPTRKLTATLSIYFQEGAAPFYINENIDYIAGHSNFLCRWAAWAVFNFKQAHEKISLESLFYESQIRVYGLPRYCDPAEGEASLLFNGMLMLQQDKVLIYKFRHIDPPSGYLTRFFSFGVWVNTLKNPPFWVIFPNFCGLDSGRGFSTYKKFGSLISMLKEKLEVEIRNFDIQYEELDTFLLGHATSFNSICREHDLYNIFYYNGPIRVLKGSEKEFDKFKERLQNKEYPQALRDLRALVQQAEENLVKLKELDYSKIKEPDVNKLASFLVEEGIIDGRLRSWFQAFTSIANIASHKNFPSQQDLKKGVLRVKIMLTFQLGLQLLEELDEPLIKPIDFVEFSEEIPNVKIPQEESD